jgi:hypothetical protein
MFFPGYYQLIGQVDKTLLEQVNSNIEIFEEKQAYNFQHGEWLRLDSYHNPENYKLEDIAGSEIINAVTAMFPEDELFGWSISYLKGKSEVVDHTDRMMFHRMAKRVIVLVNDVPDVLNWHWFSKDTRVNYLLEYGNVYRLNTSITHGLKNNNSNNRRAIYFDMMPKRLHDKFKSHQDIVSVILADAVGEKYVL